MKIGDVEDPGKSKSSEIDGPGSSGGWGKQHVRCKKGQLLTEIANDKRGIGGPGELILKIKLIRVLRMRKEDAQLPLEKFSEIGKSLQKWGTTSKRAKCLGAGLSRRDVRRKNLVTSVGAGRKKKGLGGRGHVGDVRGSSRLRHLEDCKLRLPRTLIGE